VPDFAAFAAALAGFDWDEGNADKNVVRHGVTRSEAEEAFFNHPVLLLDDTTHSAQERRYLVLGCTNTARLLSVVFTVRGDLIRVISARPMSRKERAHYAAIASETP
jgi:uncharacterized DUF497 family protein